MSTDSSGALAHHFDSMESLASAIIEEGAKLVLEVLGGMSDSFSPALENMVHGSFVTADLFASDKAARTAKDVKIIRDLHAGSVGGEHRK